MASDTIPYRIPAIAEVEDGKLVALTDFRHCGNDIGYGRVDIHGKISKDNGRTWGEEFIVIEGSGIPGSNDCGFGDAALAADRETGELLLMLVCGETVYWYPTTTRQNPNKFALLRSSDGGRSWSEWQEITEDIYTLFDDCAHGCVQSSFVGSGKICQSRKIKVGSHYRIYAALCARPNGNRVIYSDDFGHTWNVLGSVDALPVRNGDEPKCEELPDGSIIISSRTVGGRLFNIFRYSDIGKGEGEWGEAVFSGEKNNGCTAITNGCNGEILIVPAVCKEDRRKVKLVLQSVPLGPGRSNVGIYYKELPEDIATLTPESLAADWETPYQVSDTTSAYSTMVQMKNGKIAFYYEEENTPCGRGYDMVYKELSIEEITSDRYRK